MGNTTSSSSRFRDVSVTYDPFHHSSYPMHGQDYGNNRNILAAILKEDLPKIKRNFSAIRTYNSSYYGEDIVPHANEVGLRVCLGVYMTRESWKENEIQSAINSAKNYPDTVCGILVGNENVMPTNPEGTFTASEICNVIDRIRRELRAVGIDNIPIGTSQRYVDWIRNDSGVKLLTKKSSLIGVNVYPFFSEGWNRNNPTAILDGQWQSLLDKYPGKEDALCITETGWPTQGYAPSGYPASKPSLQNAKAYFEGLLEWAKRNDTAGIYVFKYFDRRPDDPMVRDGSRYEQFFGLCDRDGNPKFDF